jgi:hypothetical protein
MMQRTAGSDRSRKKPRSQGDIFQFFAPHKLPLAVPADQRRKQLESKQEQRGRELDGCR